MSIEKWSEAIWVVTLSDEPALSEELLGTLDSIQRIQPTPNLVIDMSGVTHLNSSNLSQLLRVRKAMVDRDCRMVIAGMPDSVWAVFLTTGLDKVFDFQSDLPSALAGLQLER